MYENKEKKKKKKVYRGVYYVMCKCVVRILKNNDFDVIRHGHVLVMVSHAPFCLRATCDLYLKLKIKIHKIMPPI